MVDVKFKKERKRMVEEQLLGSGITDPKVIEAMGKIPRHSFIPKRYQGDAYKNQPCRIGEGQTISQPYIVALMTEMLQLTGSEKVLEIGTGSGYQTAILAELSDKVFSIERHKVLAENAALLLSDLGYHTIQVGLGDGSAGLAKQAPFDVILVTAGSPKISKQLLDQLAEGGRLLAPVGSEEKQYLTLYHRQGDNFLEDVSIPVVFVPLIGKFGWKDDEWTRLRNQR